jgi:GTPase SAR1 family protein
MEKYKQYTEEQLKLADVVLLVFDVTDKSSFESISSKWIQLIKNNAKPNHLLFIVANKIDYANQILI